MTDTGIKLSEADKLRLAKFRQKAIFSHLWKSGKSHPKDNSNIFSRKLANTKPLSGSNVHSGLKKKPFISVPTPRTPVVPLQQPQFDVAETTPRESPRFVHDEICRPIPSQADSSEITLTKEECFCAVMNILLEGMSKTDKASKDAAKYLMLVMENEAGSSVSLLVYNSYVRRYNSLRQQYFLSTAANIKAKTIKISSDIIESLEQMAKTINLEMSLPVNIPRRTS